MNDEVTKAIRAAFDPNQAPNVKAQAVAYCESLKQSPEGWRVCLAGLAQSQVEEVKFWCLEVIHHAAQNHYHLLPENDRVLLRRSLMLYVKDVIPVTTQPAFVKNKLSLVLVKIIKVDYPERWGSFFTEFLSLVSNSSYNEQIVDVFLRVLQTIDDEIVSFEEGRSKEEIQRCTAIKDSLKTDCMREIVDCMYRILHNSAILSQTLARACLDTLSEYIGWIDLDLVGNQRFVSLFYSLLQNTNLRSSAAQCLTEMVYKRMVPEKKVALLKHLDIVAVLLRFPLVPQSDPDFLVAMATLASTLGQQILSCTQIGSKLMSRGIVEEVDVTVSQQAMLMLDQALHLGYQFLGHDLMLVCDAMTEFYLMYTNMVKADEHLPGAMTHFRLILTCIAKTLQYPLWYQFDRPGDREIKFDDFRSGGPGRIFINQVRCLPDLCIDFLKEHATKVFANQQPTFQMVEAVLRLLYLSPEGLKSLEKQLKDDQPFRELVCRLFAACSSESHPHLQMEYFRCVVRFSAIFQYEQQMMIPILTCFLDGRGLRSAHEGLRSQACYLLLKLIKQLPPELKKNLRPVLDPLLKALLDFVLPFFLCTGLPSHLDDCLYICELMGVLVSSAVVGQDRTFCAKALSFFQQQLQTKLCERVDEESQIQLFGTKVSHLISAMGHLSKSLTHDAKVVAPLFGESLTTVLSVYVLQPKHEDVRKMTIFFLHRMADCLAEEVIVFLPASLDILLRHSEPSNITPLLQLLNQLIVKFKAKMLPTIDVLFIQLVNKTYQCIESYSFVDKAVTAADIIAVGPDSQERLSLFKLYYSLFKGIIGCGCIPVINSSRNLAHIELVLRSVALGCASPESGVQKSCFYTLNEIVTYLQSQRSVSENVYKFVLEDITPKSVMCIFLPHLELRDAATLLLHMEIVRFYINMSKVVPQFLDCLGNCFVSASFPTNLVHEFCALITRGESIGAKNILKQFIEMKQAGQR